MSAGENISSIEFERALLPDLAIQEVAVVGISHERWGEAPEAFVVLKSDASVSEADLREFARATLAHFNVPHRFTFVEELRKTSTQRDRRCDTP